MERICRGIDHVVVVKNLEEYICEIDDNGKWVPKVFPDGTLHRHKYKCVLQNLGEEAHIETICADADWRHGKETNPETGEIVDVTYTVFTFEGVDSAETRPHNGCTNNLKVGKVSLAIFDNDTYDVVYYNKSYAKVFETILD